MSIPADIPFLDLITPHVELEQELTTVFQQALRTAGFIGGAMVEDFENAFAGFCTTSMLWRSIAEPMLCVCLDGCRSKPRRGGRNRSHTFMPPRKQYHRRELLPEFVDIDERTYNLDSEKLRDYLENKCRVEESGKVISKRSERPVTAIVPDHLYGPMADMDPIIALAEQYGLIVVEDACQAHGAEYLSRELNRGYGWRKAGSMGRAAAFSFYPGKNLGACGEAGAVTTNDAEVAAKVRMLRDHGQSKKYYHDVEGYNGRLDAIQAGILHVKLNHLSEWNDRRAECAAEYNRLLAAAANSMILPYEPSWSRAVYHLYVVRIETRL
jgi:dTDP-4-amino-4,6-dideoxygalactose transaminase